jgi:hypothetical protein
LPGLEKDIAGLKREIRERDDTIGDKERRIYELKKKNQELEKFKFVLDYKIKELKKQVRRVVCVNAVGRRGQGCTWRVGPLYGRLCASLVTPPHPSARTRHPRPTRPAAPHQIEPREVEIGEMRETIRAMDAELERYHKSNAALDLTIQVPAGTWQPRPAARARSTCTQCTAAACAAHTRAPTHAPHAPHPTPRSPAPLAEAAAQGERAAGRGGVAARRARRQPGAGAQAAVRHC